MALLREWLQRPHVREHWDDQGEDFFPENDPRDFKPYIAYVDEKPIAYVQSYVAIDAGDGWWPDQHDRSVIGIDLFIADAANLDRGIGTELVRQFASFVFADPGITRIQIDPWPQNLRAIRCYEKAGFRRVADIVTPDGPALLMHLECGARGAALDACTHEERRHGRRTPD